MMKIVARGKAVFFVAAALFVFGGYAMAETRFPDPPAEPTASASRGPLIAVFAGGCFWGVEGVFERVKGVSDVVSGYSGGTVADPGYELVSTGLTGHAESVRITYDPSIVSYGTLLKIFFSVAHDPTELNYQGPDEGTQYRSAVFFTNEDQRKTVVEYVRKLDAARVFSSPIVTQIAPLSAFYPAEEYHQHFLDRNPDYPYIVYWDLPKIENLKRAYPELLNGK
jgi:peptide-methionine (S)-S-oxide reductase